MKNFDRPWLSDMMRATTVPAQLDRAAFVATYFPQYVDVYRLDYRIRLRPDGRATHATPGTAKAQQTKRDTRIDAAFAAYCSDRSALVGMQTQTATT
jgi:hypothetical protein